MSGAALTMATNAAYWHNRIEPDQMPWNRIPGFTYGELVIEWQGAMGDPDEVFCPALVYAHFKPNRSCQPLSSILEAPAYRWTSEALCIDGQADA